MSDFKKQILEDIEDYRENNPNIENIEKDEWAFNYWVLDKLFSEDEQLIEEKIIDYNDKGIDCYVWHEDLHDLYLIQNKFYSKDTAINNNYVQNDFLTRAIGALEKGTYPRSAELQNIFNKYRDESDFMIHFHLYVTNNKVKTQKVMDGIADYNQKHKKYSASIFDLDDIENLYYHEPKVDKKTLDFDIKTINKGTVLEINNKAYEMTQALDAKFILTPVTVIYEMMKEAEKENYPLFDANIREYLGTSGNVNKGIIETLKSKSDRVNFFYYNNGITIIANDIGTRENKGAYQSYRVKDPQIVNGCQTVSTIYETLKSLPESTLDEQFKDTYVMAKVLKIPNEDESLKTLYRDIVTYNNSQNNINQKTFVANSSEFIRLQREFERKGLLICIKQSDKHKFKNEYEKATKLIDKNSELLKKFGLENKKKTKDFLIDLEKLLQVVLAFSDGAANAIRNKSKLLKPSSDENSKVISVIKSQDLTINALIDLYLLYLRAEQEKKNSKSGRIPIPLYLIYCFAHYECNDSVANISKKLESKEDVDRIIKLYKLTINRYYKVWQRKNNEKGYNVMIKSAIDKDLLSEARDIYLSVVDEEMD